MGEVNNKKVALKNQSGGFKYRTPDIMSGWSETKNKISIFHWVGRIGKQPSTTQHYLVGHLVVH